MSTENEVPADPDEDDDEHEPKKKAEALRDDLVWGAKAIGDEIGLKARQVYNIAEKQFLPIRKVGALLVASKRELRQRLTASKLAEK